MLFEELPDLEAHKKGRDILLTFQDDVVKPLSEAGAYSDDHSFQSCKVSEA